MSQIVEVQARSPSPAALTARVLLREAQLGRDGVANVSESANRFLTYRLEDREHETFVIGNTHGVSVASVLWPPLRNAAIPGFRTSHRASSRRMTLHLTSRVVIAYLWAQGIVGVAR